MLHPLQCVSGMEFHFTQSFTHIWECKFQGPSTSDQTEAQPYTCVPVLPGSDITGPWCTSRNIYFIHNRAGSLGQLNYRALSGHHIKSLNSARSQVQTTQPYSLSIPHPSSTSNVLDPQCLMDTVPHWILKHYCKVQANTYRLCSDRIPHITKHN